MSTFADAFKTLVMPELARACRLQALSVERGRCGFGEAHHGVLRQAIARGAVHLPDGILADMEDWITNTILQTIIAIETTPETAKAIVAETEATWRTV